MIHSPFQLDKNLQHVHSQSFWDCDREGTARPALGREPSLSCCQHLHVEDALFRIFVRKHGGAKSWCCLWNMVLRAAVEVWAGGWFVHGAITRSWSGLACRVWKQSMPKINLLTLTRSVWFYPSTLTRSVWFNPFTQARSVYLTLSSWLGDVHEWSGQASLEVKCLGIMEWNHIIHHALIPSPCKGLTEWTPSPWQCLVLE